ncbi:MAG: lysophospholipase [Candidatus Omnitrophica bacterium]|nr:lysophospholipase [Candidatus Omnitrophota bacterium]
MSLSETWKTEHGLELRLRKWSVESSPAAQLWISHGFGEHSGRYDEFAGHMTGAGCEVFSWDHQGFGESQGSRGHVDDFSAYARDGLAIIEANRNNELPQFLLGHSMGTLIALDLILDFRLNVDGLILSAPAFGIAHQPSKVQKLLLDKAGQAIHPGLKFKTGTDPSMGTHDPEIIARHREDPLAVHKISLGLYRNLIQTGEAHAGRGTELFTPLLLLQGSEDPVVRVDWVNAYFESVSSTDKHMELCPGCYHEVLNETERSQVYELVSRWISDRVGAPKVAGDGESSS